MTLRLGSASKSLSHLMPITMLRRVPVTGDYWWSLSGMRAILSLVDSGDKLDRLLLGFGGVVGPSRHQACDKCAEQGFAASAGVVHELEEAGVSRTHPHERIGMGCGAV